MEGIEPAQQNRRCRSADGREFARADVYRKDRSVRRRRGRRRAGAVMDWARILAYVAGTVDQELLGERIRCD